MSRGGRRRWCRAVKIWIQWSENYRVEAADYNVVTRVFTPARALLLKNNNNNNNRNSNNNHNNNDNGTRKGASPGGGGTRGKKKLRRKTVTHHGTAVERVYLSCVRRRAPEGPDPVSLARKLFKKCSIYTRRDQDTERRDPTVCYRVL